MRGLIEEDIKILEAMAKIRKPATANYLAKSCELPVSVVTPRLMTLVPILVLSEKSKIRNEGREYVVQSYRLRDPELTAEQLFGRRTCPHPSMLRIIE